LPKLRVCLFQRHTANASRNLGACVPIARGHISGGLQLVQLARARGGTAWLSLDNRDAWLLDSCRISRQRMVSRECFPAMVRLP